MQADDTFMLQAVALAERGAGRTSPNPMVGCVLVRDGVVIGEGFHRGPGTDHAEVGAIKSATGETAGATAYVTLEPCNHHGRTPPCTVGLIAAGVRRVVYGVSDPNPLAAGGGERLRAAGIDVAIATGIAAEAAADLVAPWVFSLTATRPYIVAKWAATLDGHTATGAGSSKWITGQEARMRAHDLRQRADAVMVGIGTILKDDPALDPRPEHVDPAPGTKVVFDTHLRCPTSARFLTSPGQSIIVCAHGADSNRKRALAGAGVTLCEVSATDGRTDIPEALRALRQAGITMAMIEGGATLLGAAMAAGVVDEVWAFIAPKLLGGGTPIAAGIGVDLIGDAAPLRLITTEKLGNDIFIRARRELQADARGQS